MNRHYAIKPDGMTAENLRSTLHALIPDHIPPHATVKVLAFPKENQPYDPKAWLSFEWEEDAP